MILRLLKKSDIKQASAIVGKNYSKKWEKSSAKELQSMFSNAAIKPVYWVAEEKGKILGFAGYTQSWMDYSIFEIFWVNVLPARQSGGIGKQLVAKVISEIKKNKGACLILLTANQGKLMTHYYKKYFGFKNLQIFEKQSHRLMVLKIEK